MKRIESNTKPHVEVLAKPYGYLVQVVREGGLAIWQRKSYSGGALRTILDRAAKVRKADLRNEEKVRGLRPGSLQ